MGTKAGFSIDDSTARDLHVLAFISGTSKSTVVEQAIAARVASLPPRARSAFDAARESRRARP
jgi:hypothetical protein